MIHQHPLSRRATLKALGAIVALPWLESFSRATEVKPPVRLGFCYVPNGVNWRRWHLEEAGPLQKLSPTLSPLDDVKQDLLVFRNLALNEGRDHGDGGGDHPRATSSFLTAAHAYKSFGKDIRVGGISLDQLAAQRRGHLTRLPSLELACDRPTSPGMCDAGYSGVYRNAISWRTPTSPVPTELNPRLVFQRMFGTIERGKSRATSSVLDLVMEETKALNGSLAGADRRKLDEYLYSVREVEQQIQKAVTFPVKELPPGTVSPEGIPPEVPDHIKVMLDLVALAYQTDTTRIASVMFAVGGSDRAFPFLGISSSHHHYSHHERKPENLDALHAIDKFYVSQFGYLIRKLKNIPEGAGSVLDSCLFLYGSPLRDGNLHDRGDLPILLAGAGGGAITPGRAIQYTTETPLANLYLNMLDAFGIQEQRFSDSTGRLADLRN
jgi:hypothetical protein